VSGARYYYCIGGDSLPPFCSIVKPANNNSH
jgi:hypothetical protein